MDPFYFGNDGVARFGVYHAPSRRTDACGVVLCYPLGHEYVRSHRAYRNLALALSRAGMPVLRFDYVGSGDSAGDADDAGLASWSRDIDFAVEEVKKRAQVPRVSLIGLRFGGTLAALAATRRDDIESVLLWDPVLSGREYLGELRLVQDRWVNDRLGVAAEHVPSGDRQLIGLPIDAARVDELASVNLRAVDDFRVRILDLVVSVPRQDCHEWQQALTDRGFQARYWHVPTAGDWLNPEALHQLLLPHDILKQIVSIMMR